MTHRWPHPGSGADHRNAKLDPQKIETIRTMREQGATLRQIAREAGVSPATVHSALTGRTYSKK